MLLALLHTRAEFAACWVCTAVEGNATNCNSFDRSKLSGFKHSNRSVMRRQLYVKNCGHCTMENCAMTHVGTKRGSSSPCPSLPKFPLPHDHTRPSVSTAKEWNIPQETFATRTSTGKGIRTGRGTCENLTGGLVIVSGRASPYSTPSPPSVALLLPPQPQQFPRLSTTRQ